MIFILFIFIIAYLIIFNHIVIIHIVIYFIVIFVITTNHNFLLFKFYYRFSTLKPLVLR